MTLPSRRNLLEHPPGVILDGLCGTTPQTTIVAVAVLTWTVCSSTNHSKIYPRVTYYQYLTIQYLAKTSYPG